MQFNLVVSLTLAIFFLGESLTPLRVLGILLIAAGPLLVRRNAAPGASLLERPAFTPRFAEGYGFAALAAICYGASPALVRYAADGNGVAASLAGGVIASAAATAVMLALLLAPGHRRELRAVTPEAAKWFLSSGMLVYVSQIFAYMAVAIAPVTVTAPMLGLSNIFRLYFSKLLNPDHEMFGREVIVATALSFVGVVALTASVESLPLPAGWAAVLNWSWP
jgi:drug/metabolite transporter (DMT)-like permease